MNIPVFLNNTKVGSIDKCENITQFVFDNYKHCVPTDHKIQKIFVVGDAQYPQNVVIVTIPKERI